LVEVRKQLEASKKITKRPAQILHKESGQETSGNVLKLRD
jgi:hypothetical protein